jgi:decaprenyl-phosphate phosphoribosyltransferase
MLRRRHGAIRVPGLGTPQGSAVTEQATRATAPPSLLLGMVKACRPKQWAKNVLVFVAPAAAGVITEPYRLRLTVIGFIAFCMVSSATYLLNDILDVESDRKHPTKCNRPIAAGVVPVPLAVLMAVVLFVGGLGVAFIDNWQLTLVVATYAVLTTTYSLFLKAIPVLDLVILSAGFILRLLGGAYAAEVPVSDWFLIISLFGSLFIAAAKRFAEKQELGDRAAELRPTLGEYSLQYLGFLRAVSVAALVMSYCLWAVERAHIDDASPWAQLSIIPFLIAVLRYALLVDQGKGSAPEDVILHDRQMQIMGVIWAVVLAIGIYA